MVIRIIFRQSHMNIAGATEVFLQHFHMAMDQYLLIPFLVGWTSIYQLFWCSPGVLLVLTHCHIEPWSSRSCFGQAGDYYNGVTTGLCCLQHPRKMWSFWENLQETMGHPMKIMGCSCKFLLNQSIDDIYLVLRILDNNYPFFNGEINKNIIRSMVTNWIST